jgi:hypothetical protein
MLRHRILGRISIFCLVIRCGKGGGGPEKVNQGISRKGFFCIVKRERFWNLSRGMPLPFPGKNFTGNRNDRNTVLEAGKSPNSKKKFL